MWTKTNKNKQIYKQQQTKLKQQQTKCKQQQKM